MKKTTIACLTMLAVLTLTACGSKTAGGVGSEAGSNAATMNGKTPGAAAGAPEGSAGK